MKKYLIIYLKGIMMGTADVVPGVSGGTIALITGIYERLVEVIDNFNWKNFKKIKRSRIVSSLRDLGGDFLLALLLGIATSLIAFSHLLKQLLEYRPVLLWAFFFGLVLSSIFFMFRQMAKPTVWTICILVLSTIISFIVCSMSGGVNSLGRWYLFFCGFIAAIAMILPGVSGAFILLILGVYGKVLGSINDVVLIFKEDSLSHFYNALFNLLALGLGALLGLKFFSRILKWMFTHYKELILSALVGFMIGSLVKIWPWKETIKSEFFGGKDIVIFENNILPTTHNDPQLISAIALALFGFLLVFLIEKLTVKK